MFFGILSVLQAVFLPGYLMTRLSGWRPGSIIESMIVIMALSLLFNYLLAFFLTAVGMYTRYITISLALMQLVAVFAFLAIDARRRIKRHIVIETPRLTRPWTQGSLTVLAFCSFAIAAVWSLMIGLRPNVFNTWDALFSWNAWAVEWSAGTLPQHTMLYPQLIPANWSLMYVMSGSPELQFFPLSIMPLFGIGILMMFLDLAIRKRRLEYFVALLLCLVAAFVFRGHLFGPHVSQLGGYVDLALTFYFLAPLYLLELRKARLPSSWRELGLPLIIACGAAVTKANGFYVLAVVIALGLFGHIRVRDMLSSRNWLSSIALTLFATIGIVGSWYSFKLIDFWLGRDASNARYLEQAVDAAGGAGGPIERISYAISFFPVPWPVTIIGVVTIGAALIFVPRIRWVTLGILLPYSLLWALFLSYDIRNLVPIFPIIGFVVAFGAGALLRRTLGMRMGFPVKRRVIALSEYTPALILAGLVVTAAFLATLYPTSDAISDSIERQRTIGNPELNEFLYSRFERNPDLKGDVLTDYGYFQFLPGFRSDPLRQDSTTRTRVTWVYHAGLEPKFLEDQEVLVLADNLAPTAVRDLIDERLSAGQYTLIDTFTSGPFLSYESSVTIRLIRVNH